MLIWFEPTKLQEYKKKVPKWAIKGFKDEYVCISMVKGWIKRYMQIHVYLYTMLLMMHLITSLSSQRTKSTLENSIIRKISLSLSFYLFAWVQCIIILFKHLNSSIINSFRIRNFSLDRSKKHIKNSLNIKVDDKIFRANVLTTTTIAINNKKNWYNSSNISERDI